MKTKSAGIEDVARMAGVSITTVSRVINKAATVKEANRKKVEEAIRKLHFSPSPYAQALAAGKTNTIALVIPRYEGIFYSFYALELIRGIGTLCDSLRLNLLLYLTQGKDALNGKLVSGIIFADIIANHPQVESAIREKIPVVVINNFTEGLPVGCIAVDNLKGAHEAVNYLIGLGHKRIAHIAGDMITQAARFRLEGYQKALSENGIKENPGYIIKTDYSRGQARVAAEKLLAMSEDAPTAIFVASDSMALEVITVIKEKGKRVPEDISIIGFDDNPSGLYGPVALTTVRQPLIKMGEEAVKELNNLIKGKKEITRLMLPAELVVRDSCRAIS